MQANPGIGISQTPNRLSANTNMTLSNGMATLGSPDSPELADLTGEKAREALERALERLRKQEEARL